MTLPFGEVVTLVRRSLDGYDAMGRPRYSETRVSVAHSATWPEQGSENERAGSTNTATERLTWAAPPGTRIDPTDVAEIDGVRYSIDGPARDSGTHSITGAPGRVVASLVRNT